MATPKPISSPKQLIVEGNDEVRLLKAMFKHFNIQGIQLQNCEGFDDFRKFLNAFMALSGFSDIQSLGIVADAESRRSGREQAIREALSAKGLPSPTGPLQVASNSRLSVAYLVIPSDKDSGMLENLCLDSIADDIGMPCVEYYFECIKHTSLAGPKDVWMPKARLHAFLASRDRPGMRLGEAAEKGIWDFDADVFDTLRRLLEIL